MNDRISPKQFRESEGVEDWRVLGDGANAYFRTGSLAAGARLVQAIGELPGVDALRPDVDVRHDAVTVRMNPLRDGQPGGLFLDLKFPDGKVLDSGLPKNGQPVNVPKL